ncbi:hypothetical protein QKW60_05655 [Defluviimonas aestuarii]|uniref:hypothetical protein n=1 Tax=Albidovulum aestuarii TaxID=1130726 RepID=UPI00249C70D9|nr:hypothetical protein [Defluviimonas aestuarii]MDI3335882.1 hypothetical protein [Defluviimonas aestuarii]
MNEGQMTMADHVFAEAMAAYAVNPCSDQKRQNLMLACARDVRGHLSDIPAISRLALNFDVLTTLAPGPARGSEMFDLKRNLARFHEWRLGRAQEALKRQQD